MRSFEHIAVAAGACEIRLCVFDGRPREQAFWQRNGYRFHRLLAPRQFGAKRHARTELHKLLDET